MDPSKCPYISEESLRTQRVSVYLNDLKQRIKGLRAQHDLLIQDSTEIFNEVNHVTNTLCAPHFSTEMEKIQSIKLLIQKFEEMDKQETAASTSGIPDELNSVNVRQLLQEFEELNSSNVLTESLMNFKRAKESFEKIETSLDKLNETEDSKPTKTIVVSNSLREKINMFEKKLNTDEVTLVQSGSDLADSKKTKNSNEVVQMASGSAHGIVKPTSSDKVLNFKGLQSMVSDNIKLKVSKQPVKAEVTPEPNNVKLEPIACENETKPLTDKDDLSTLACNEAISHVGTESEVMMTAGEYAEIISSRQAIIIELASKATVNTLAFSQGKEQQSVTTSASDIDIDTVASNTKDSMICDGASDTIMHSIPSDSIMHSIPSDTIMYSTNSDSIMQSLDSISEEKSFNSLQEISSLISDDVVVSASSNVMNRSTESGETQLLKDDADTGDISAVQTALFEISAEP